MCVILNGFVGQQQFRDIASLNKRLWYDRVLHERFVNSSSHHT